MSRPPTPEELEQFREEAAQRWAEGPGNKKNIPPEIQALREEAENRKLTSEQESGSV